MKVWQNFWWQRLIIVVSIAACCILLMVRISGLELLGVTPNWLLIWLVTWSVRRNIWQSAIASICLGLIWDSLTGIFPSHVLGLLVVGIFTSNVYGKEYIKEDLISIMLIVFGMAIINETITALQYSIQTQVPLTDIWLNYQKNSLTSAIISSLWTPLVYYPLNYLVNKTSEQKGR
ncbi:rod shape-determining protein MreD [Cyanobacterium aponinum FACHB-4101]|uniref:rod shape-determining protein MreD n=1 Tax=Cyanobacterium aponinum TaxID=379064 RepID=UPI00168197A6|nr:rod shape-determining protein MreD [Cyanobacterium aponinum]MBD2393060.1 rod shape-determining protein MreD [Cyanobacterium aponinum FACHB-4101]